MEKLLMGIDAGTSSCKVSLFDTAGNVIAQSTKEYRSIIQLQDTQSKILMNGGRQYVMQLMKHYIPLC